MLLKYHMTEQKRKLFPKTTTPFKELTWVQRHSADSVEMTIHYSFYWSTHQIRKRDKFKK